MAQGIASSTDYLLQDGSPPPGAAPDPHEPLPDLRVQGWWDEKVTLFGQVVMAAVAFACIGFVGVLLGGWVTGRTVTWKEPLIGAAILGISVSFTALRIPQRFGRGFGTRAQVFGYAFTLGAAVLAFSLWRLK